MEVVINIDEKIYNNIEPFLNGETIKGGINLFNTLEIIKNGTPLPKGHGRLIDADKLPLNDIDDANYGSNYIKIAPTIIEADEESEGGI